MLASGVLLVVLACLMDETGQISLPGPVKGVLAGVLLICVVAMIGELDRAEKKNRDLGAGRTVIDADDFAAAQRDPRVKALLREADLEGLRMQQRERTPFLDAVLEEMMGEGGVARARSAYESTVPAAESAFDDTGWDEPWANAMEAAFVKAVDVVQDREMEEKEQGNNE